jgi:protein-S-isoprenylcysteine O-methyltransferase Ste14
MTAEKSKPGVIKLLLTFIYLFIFPTLLLYLSGDWLWLEGWIFSIWFVVMCMTVIIYLYIKDPALLMERYKQPGTANQKGWDRYVVFGLLLGFIAWISIMPLDAQRYHWTKGFPIGVQVIGGGLLLLSFYLFFQAYAANTFASALVRIQAERKQKVISTGVYGFVRHPMYLAGVLLFIGAPLLLGSLYGLLLGCLLILLLAGRIIGEERMLVKELAGYEDYRKKVRYRLIPYIW